MKNKWIGGLLSATLACTAVVGATPVVGADKKASKNLIVLIGDGMGPAQVTAARLYLQRQKGIDHLNLDEIYVGQATTYADRGEDGGTIVSGIVTDSASAGTAFATGNKTYNAGISVSNEDVAKPYASVIEAAEKIGKATGLVTTARITHATPAVYASHVRHRDNESAIASQYLDSGVDVLFGGGKSFFLSKDEKGKRADKSIIADFEAKGYQVVGDKDGLRSLDSEKALGFFGSSHVNYVPDRSESTPNLAEMTEKAIELLSKDKDGFVMMIEGGRIDHASHANDFPSTIQETLDFDAAVKVALDFAKKDKNTSIVITADHETGGLSLSRDNIYELNDSLWDKQVHSSEHINKALSEAKSKDDVKKIVSENTWIKDLTDEEAEFILKGDGSSYKQEGAYNAVVSKRLLVGWAGHGHSGVDVGVWAYGPITELVTGNVDNTEIAKASAKVIGADLKKTTAELQAKYLYPKFKVNKEGAVLYPAEALATALGAKVENKTNEVTITQNDQKLVVNTSTLKVQLNGKEIKVVAEMDNKKLYLSLEAFAQVSGKKISWDTLSERIVFE
ncbi:alkaline phosphatase [Brevibacillus sp. SYSU BS000544]|uniref:alkaline phosphatase n=1 Tax=Brevibacillus sp. SYSU BS000544 TaxID=3416443 RepID=UPI003CE51C55